MGTSNNSSKSQHHLSVWSEDVFSETGDRSAVTNLPVPDVNQHISSDEKVDNKEDCALISIVGQKTNAVKFLKTNEKNDEKILLEEDAMQVLEAETGNKPTVEKMLNTQKNNDNRVLPLMEITKHVLEAPSGNDKALDVTNTDEHGSNKNMFPTKLTKHVLEDKSDDVSVQRVKNFPMCEKESSIDSKLETLPQSQDVQAFAAIGTAVRILLSQKVDAEGWKTNVNLILKETRASVKLNRAKIAEILMEHHFVNILEKYFQFLGSSASEPYSDSTFKNTCNSLEMNTALVSEMNSTEVKLIQYMIESGEGTWMILKKIFTIVWVLCDASEQFCQHIIDSKLMNPSLINLLKYLANMSYMSSEKFIYLVKAILGILHNIVRHIESSKWTLRDLEVVPLLQSLLSGSIRQIITTKVLIVLSYLVSEAENEIINSDDQNISFIIRVLGSAMDSEKHFSATYGMDVEETLRGLNNLAVNDSNKVRIVRNNALPLYSRLLAVGNSEEVHLAVCGLWSLGFSLSNKQKIKETPGILEKLQELQHQCVRKDTSHAARGVVWELESIPVTASITDACTSPITDLLHEHLCPHVMISYQWDSQPIMMKVKDKLRCAGYKVWMDVEHMTGSTLEAMALAVEKASVVLICMSEKYKDSPNCRSESEYVYRLRKDFIPLRLQPTYTPDGWLGMMVGTRLYFDFSDVSKLDTQLSKLIKELGNRGKIGYMDTVDAPLLERVMSRETSPPKAEMDILNWTSNNVATWLTTLGLENKKERFDEIDGSLLLELRKIHKSAPEFLYTMLKHDFGLGAVEILKFSRALRALNP
ncbi:hypothetical protein CHS0354_010584 [Potamilus streckersoni]|uniref:TIR domain-containing protein n=1 Tax=Potamilus streckersoni TaxID=2493646 RepID=A0AAE0S699_9BIVA|nr:hypothetical protein CHS0354_010584 [Potamilus streckersoni]